MPLKYLNCPGFPRSKSPAYPHVLDLKDANGDYENLSLKDVVATVLYRYNPEFLRKFINPVLDDCITFTWKSDGICDNWAITIGRSGEHVWVCCSLTFEFSLTDYLVQCGYELLNVKGPLFSFRLRVLKVDYHMILKGGKKGTWVIDEAYEAVGSRDMEKVIPESASLRRLAHWIACRPYIWNGTIGTIKTSHPEIKCLHHDKDEYNHEVSDQDDNEGITNISREAKGDEDLGILPLSDDDTEPLPSRMRPELKKYLDTTVLAERYDAFIKEMAEDQRSKIKRLRKIAKSSDDDQVKDILKDMKNDYLKIDKLLQSSQGEYFSYYL